MGRSRGEVHGKYLDDGSNQGSAWRATHFDDLAWPAGPAELGCGNASDGRPERTVIRFGTNAASKHITSYFRHAWVVADPGSGISTARTAGSTSSRRPPSSGDARWNPVYKPGISLSGVGHRVAHNLIHNAPHEGIAFGGNDHLIEFNEFHTLVHESNDAGVICAGRTWTARGHVIRYNDFHHPYDLERRGCNAVYLDDQFSSARVYGNVFFQVPPGVLLGGIRDNLVENNVFIQCQTAISLDARGLGWASNGVVDLNNDLLSLPYQSPPWSLRHPEPTNILNEKPMAPRGNVLAHNVAWGGGWTRIETLAQPGDAVELSWPLSAADSVLETAPAVPSAAWSELAQPTAVTADRVAVTAPVEPREGARYFRLSRP